jgi:hypothetical protein
MQGTGCTPAFSISGLLIRFEYADIIYDHFLGKHCRPVGVARPVSSYGYIENEEEFFVEFTEIRRGDVDGIEQNVIDIPFDFRFIPDDREHMKFIVKDSAGQHVR